LREIERISKKSCHSFRPFPDSIVQSFYKVYLNRPADPSGLAAFTNLLATGGRDETVIAQLVESAEFYSGS
jgi:Domain of unknown function (DUF4214)